MVELHLHTLMWCLIKPMDNVVFNLSLSRWRCWQQLYALQHCHACNMKSSLSFDSSTLKHPFIGEPHGFESVRAVHWSVLRDMLVLGRKHCKVVTGILTGHCTLRWHMHVMGLSESATYRMRSLSTIYFITSHLLAKHIVKIFSSACLESVCRVAQEERSVF